MYWLDQLILFKKEAKETFNGISTKTGIPQTTVEKLFSGRTRDPKMNMVNKIVTLLGHSISELLPERDRGVNLYSSEIGEFVAKYSQLEPSARAMIESLADYELRRQEKRRLAQITYSRIYYDFPVSAGTGEFLDNSTAEIVELECEPPSGTDFVLRVSGDSMEPQFHDGDKVYVEKTNMVEYGEIGIFVYGGSVYMKEYTPEGLRSFNPEYRLIEGNPYIKCLGRVLGVVKGAAAIA